MSGYGDNFKVMELPTSIYHFILDVVIKKTLSIKSYVGSEQTSLMRKKRLGQYRITEQYYFKRRKPLTVLSCEQVPGVYQVISKLVKNLYESKKR